MILIADGGSTKIDWCLLEAGAVVKRFASQGLNPCMLTRDEISARLTLDVRDELSGYAERLRDVYFYGAGCLPGQVSDTMAQALRPVVGERPRIHVSNDLISAARAVCGNSPGIACILGTGSNSCYYDGREIVDNVSPLGFILGDEGSGAVLGRQLLGAVLKRQLPPELCREFLVTYDLDLHTIIKRVYRTPAPNRFLASLAPFLEKHMDVEGVRDIVRDQFRLFFERNVANYAIYGPCEVHFVGSIAYHYQHILREVAEELGYRIGRIIVSPMDGLIAYHTATEAANLNSCQ
ncbi:MAG: ATPase [Candidatus Amulumruptor caecigallinarius]|nr:ATPase [Candidatus Amulumruptor caecigallinarius]MCM1397317.1 ATPase [Candidatus Amulumruptor caecigallinarius]MCM1453618.1 ATPase [bacterium]